MGTKIIRNRVQCIHCNDVIESKHSHDFQTCSCGRVSVDGGRDYLKRSCDSQDDYIELSETRTDNDRPSVADCLEEVTEYLENMTPEEKVEFNRKYQEFYRKGHPNRDAYKRYDYHPTQRWCELAAQSKFMTVEECEAHRKKQLIILDEIYADFEDGAEASAFKGYPNTLADVLNEINMLEREMEITQLSAEVLREWEGVHGKPYPDFSPI